ncbi:MAG: branched-chain amino acid ABC transporter permease [Alphaproteobacteria bacterium]
MTDLELILQTIVNSLIASSFTAIFTVGLVLIFGIMQIVNFAHGALYMVGAFATWYLYSEIGIPFFVAIILATLLTVALGLVMERALFRPMRGNLFGGLIVSVGMMFILEVLSVYLFGQGLMKNITPYFKESWHVFGIESVTVAHSRLFVFAVATFILVSFWLFMSRTRLGWAMRACAQNPEAAARQGISIGKISMLAMGISAAMAGAGGAVMAPLVRITPQMGHPVLITAFIVMIVGGMGSIEGALIAAFAYSFFHTFITTYVGGEVATILGLVLMLVVLIARPTGIMGERESV